MLKVYGASDDLIELDGDISEEFGTCNSDGDYLAFSDGTLLKAIYDNDGIWRMNIISKGILFKEKIDGDVIKDENDIIIFNDGIKWCVCGKYLAK